MGYMLVCNRLDVLCMVYLLFLSFYLINQLNCVNDGQSQSESTKTTAYIEKSIFCVEPYIVASNLNLSIYQLVLIVICNLFYLFNI